MQMRWKYPTHYKRATKPVFISTKIIKNVQLDENKYRIRL